MDEKLDEIPFESKRAMACAALFTDIFQKYIEAHQCENIPEQNKDELDQFATEILDHVIIVGGFCRDLLLNRTIKDIDIIINLRELCKLQTNHLKKYHHKQADQSRENRCVYWQRYLQKFSDESNLNEAQAQNQEMVAMHNVNYLLNSKFWVDILRNDALLDNKLSVRDVPDSGFISAEIVNSVIYGNVNLDKQAIDFVDTFNIADKHFNDDYLSGTVSFSLFHRKSRQLSMSGILIDGLGRVDKRTANDNNKMDGGGAFADKPNKSRPEREDALDDDDDDEDDDIEEDEDDDDGGALQIVSANGAGAGTGGAHGAHGGGQRKQRLKSMALIDVGIEELGTDFGDFGLSKGTKSRQELIVISVPVYSGKVRYKLLNYDFSINTGILPLSNIVQLKHYNNQVSGGSDDDDAAPMTWLEIVENGLGECDAIEDCQTFKILRAPELGHEDCTFEVHPVSFIFWRIIQWLIREPSFELDQRLQNAQIVDFKKWCTPEWFGERDNCERFLQHMVRILEEECSNLNDVRQMLSTMKRLQFNDRFANIANQEQSVRHALIDAVTNVQNEHLNNSAIISELQNCGYSVDEPLFKVPSKTEEELKQMTSQKQYLEGELEQRNKRIQDLEKQNDRLLKEIQYLQELNQTSDRVKNLEAQNGRLLQELQSLNESKRDLAVTANGTIDELRSYLLQYQRAAMAKQNN
eukprot:CAMPEP_0202689444 /NCGR_PEP_ID=MMETSP1385-20130828/4705_1 /ASSEMBLY_ACC=CAM_ASM_000861 /TAXON_ID=933848 /ORGANISM="Elphidium margaritaceum" /LENGTH=694 /DNA_ID=CAMNT_0049344577 /DNA_START=44 /DNA_END=2128 /DNA_ORIENTATION=-